MRFVAMAKKQWIPVIVAGVLGTAVGGALQYEYQQARVASA